MELIIPALLEVHLEHICHKRAADVSKLRGSRSQTVWETLISHVKDGRRGEGSESVTDVTMTKEEAAAAANESSPHFLWFNRPERVLICGGISNTKKHCGLDRRLQRDVIKMWTVRRHTPRRDDVWRPGG